MDYSCVVQVGDWHFEVKLIRGIKTPAYGQPYSATLMITVVNGVAYIENFIARESHKITKADLKDITTFVKALGFKSAVFDRYKDGIKTSKIKSINNDLKAAR